MSAPTPFISVIVVCKNPGLRLRSALASVWAQQVIEPELIVIDSASTDGSREWLAAQRPQITTLVSEPDRGIYEAMNKGIALAHGEWVLFLGADDLLSGPEILSQTRHQLAKTGAGVAIGEAVYDDGRIYRFTSGANPAARNFVHHQAAFYRRRLFAEHGTFDSSLGVMSDYDLNLRLWKNQVRFESLTLRISICGSNGLSDAGRWRGYAEEIRVRHRYFPLWRCCWWDAGAIARFLRKKIVRSFPSHG